MLEIQALLFLVSADFNLVAFALTGNLLLTSLLALIVGFIGVSAVGQNHAKNGFLFGINSAVAMFVSSLILVLMGVSEPAGIVFSLILSPINIILGLAGGLLTKKIKWPSNPLSIINNSEIRERGKYDKLYFAGYIISVALFFLRAANIYAKTATAIGFVAIFLIKGINKRQRLILVGIYLLAMIIMFIALTGKTLEPLSQ